MDTFSDFYQHLLLEDVVNSKNIFYYDNLGNLSWLVMDEESIKIIDTLDQLESGIALDYAWSTELEPRGQKWLTKTFIKWFVNNDNVGVSTGYRPMKGDPQWMMNRDDLTIKLIDPATNTVVTHLVDWMRSLDESELNKLYKVTVDQAIIKADQWVVATNKKADELAARVGTEGTEVMQEWPDGYKMLRLESQDAKAVEGNLMGHCVGGGGYASATIYSLRDPDNKPHVTIEARNGGRDLKQIRGKQNAIPNKKYMKYVRQFVVNGNYHVTDPGIDLGLISWHGEKYDPDSPEWAAKYKEQIEPHQQRMIRLHDRKIRPNPNGKGRILQHGVALNDMFLKKLPDWSDVLVDGNFMVGGNDLTSLKGSPKVVRGNFDCSNNELKDLVGGPETVAYNMMVGGNELESLEGAPEEIGGKFNSQPKRRQQGGDFTQTDYETFRRARENGVSFKDFWKAYKK